MSDDKQYHVSLNYSCMASSADEALQLAIDVAGSANGISVEVFEGDKDVPALEGDHGQLLEVRRTRRELEARFGPGFSNGVYGILAHTRLPSQFSVKDWADWFFKPAEAAFDMAHELHLIEPVPAMVKTWAFTALGERVAQSVQAELTVRA